MAQSILEHQNYRIYLKCVLVERADANPAYSLRALARNLTLAPSYLSAILSGKKNLSAERALETAAGLQLNETEREYFCLLVQIESTTDPALKDSLLKRVRQLNPNVGVYDLSLDHFKIISDWPHFAI